MALCGVNQAACEQLGYTAEELSGIAIGQVCPSADVAALAELMDSHVDGSLTTLKFHVALRRKDGQTFAAEWRLCHLPDSDGGGWIVVVRDSPTVGPDDSLLAVGADTCYLGLPGHDPLTGLPDRRLFERLLTRAWERLRRHKDYMFAVCFIDLDGFKGINDRFGHLTGDRVLCEVARRLVGCVRPGDMAARFGGDEFTVLIDDVPDDRSGVLVARRMLEQIRQPMAIEAGSIRIGASIGVAIGTGVHRRIEGLLHDADRAMYRVKSSGGNGVELIRESPSHRQIKPR